MASALYPIGRKAILDGSIHWLTDTIKAVLVDNADYTYSSAHDFLDDVPAGARVATGTLAGKTSTDGVADADDLVFTSASGDVSETIIIYKDSGVESTSPLIAFIDGLSVTPNGGNITIQWDNGANKIFKV